VPGVQAQSPEFKPQSHPKTKKPKISPVLNMSGFFHIIIPQTI
jgi:hypothetical protein